MPTGHPTHKPSAASRALNNRAAITQNWIEHPHREPKKCTAHPTETALRYVGTTGYCKNCTDAAIRAAKIDSGYARIVNSKIGE